MEWNWSSAATKQMSPNMYLQMRWSAQGHGGKCCCNTWGDGDSLTGSADRGGDAESSLIMGKKKNGASVVLTGGSTGTVHTCRLFLSARAWPLSTRQTGHQPHSFPWHTLIISNVPKLNLQLMQLDYKQHRHIQMIKYQHIKVTELTRLQ